MELQIFEMPTRYEPHSTFESLKDVELNDRIFTGPEQAALTLERSIMKINSRLGLLAIGISDHHASFTANRSGESVNGHIAMHHEAAFKDGTLHVTPHNKKGTVLWLDDTKEDVTTSLDFDGTLRVMDIAATMITAEDEPEDMDRNNGRHLRLVTAARENSGRYLEVSKVADLSELKDTAGQDLLYVANYVIEVADRLPELLV